MFLLIAGFLIFLILWILAWRNIPILGFGIFLGLAIAGVIASLVRPFSVMNMPVWLPAIPLAFVAISLFSFGILAWYWGREQ